MITIRIFKMLEGDCFKMYVRAVQWFSSGCIFLQESKRSFLHNIINEEGDNEKIESFVNFCEDTIFEVCRLCITEPIRNVIRDPRLIHIRNIIRSHLNLSREIQNLFLAWFSIRDSILKDYRM